MSSFTTLASAKATPRCTIYSLGRRRYLPISGHRSIHFRARWSRASRSSRRQCWLFRSRDFPAPQPNSTNSFCIRNPWRRARIFSSRVDRYRLQYWSSSSSSCDPVFSEAVAQTIAAAYFNPSQCVLLRLPALHDSAADLSRQIVVATEAIRATGIVLPRVAAQNVFLARFDLPESFFDAYPQVSLMLDETFEFWRYTRALYLKLQSVSYLLGGDQRRLQSVVDGLTKLFGRPPTGQSIAQTVPPIFLTFRDMAIKVRKR
jgi:hypothetical protein